MSSSNDYKRGTGSYLWHLRLGHIGNGGPDAKIVKKSYGTGIELASVNKWETCSGCALGKKMRVRYMPKLPDHTKKLLEIIHSDVSGTMQTLTFSDKRYFLVVYRQLLSLLCDISDQEQV